MQKQKKLQFADDALGVPALFKSVGHPSKPRFPGDHCREQTTDMISQIINFEEDPRLFPKCPKESPPDTRQGSSPAHLLHRSR